MEAQTRQVMGRLNPHFRRFKEPVKPHVTPPVGLKPRHDSSM